MLSVIAWPLMFWTVATRIGAATDPRPIEIASGIGDRKCEASYSLLIMRSRISAQPAVLFNVTDRPWRL
jgi:hypothetical protein